MQFPMSSKWNYILFNGEIGKVEEKKSEWGVKRGRTRDLIKVVGTKESCVGNWNCHCQVCPTGWCTAAWILQSDTAAERVAQHYCPGSEQRQGVQDEEWFICWTGPSWKTSMIRVPQGHTGGCDSSS